MIDLNLNLERMFGLIEHPCHVRFDILIPSHIPDCPPTHLWTPPKEYIFPPKNHESPHEDLWSQFVKDRYSGLDVIVRLVNATLVGNRVGPYVLALALENAFYHGNQNNPDLPVTVNTFQGTRGVIARIRDSGSGFDFKRVTQQSEEVGNRELSVYTHPENIPRDLRYFSRRGRGFFGFLSSKPKISFEDDGTVVNILYGE